MSLACENVTVFKVWQCSSFPVTGRSCLAPSTSACSNWAFLKLTAELMADVMCPICPVRGMGDLAGPGPSRDT